MMYIIAVTTRWMSDYCFGVGRAWFGIGFALHRPRIVVEIWRGSTRLRAHPVECAESIKMTDCQGSEVFCLHRRSWMIWE